MKLYNVKLLVKAAPLFLLLMFIGQCWSQTTNFKQDSVEVRTFFYYKNAEPNDLVFDNWNPPNEDELTFLIKEMDSVSTQDWNSCFGTINIGVRGEVCINNTRYNYMLDGGGWISITGLKPSVETIYLVNKGDKYLKYFAIQSHCDQNLEAKY